MDKFQTSNLFEDFELGIKLLMLLKRLRFNFRSQHQLIKTLTLEDNKNRVTKHHIFNSFTGTSSLEGRR